MLYHGLGYGSEAYLSPLTVMLNKGYDIFQLRHSPREIFDFPYKGSWQRAVIDVFGRPGPAVKAFGGWGRMWRVELLPLGFSIDEANWFANYTEHLIGGGLTMRLLDEWYKAHHVPAPRAMAMLTTYAASALNEMTEQPNAGPTAGGVADLMIFDVLAIALFHWDQPTRFFAQTLQFADWSNQAAVSFPNQQLQNNGHYMTLRIPIGLDRTRLFLRGGMGAQLGLARKLSDGEHSISFGVGGDTEVREIDETGHETVKFAPGAGLYYDRRNSLLWSVTTSPLENILAVNIYPNVFKGVPRGLGLWGVYTRRNEFRFGFVHRGALGLGVGYGR